MTYLFCLVGEGRVSVVCRRGVVGQREARRRREKGREKRGGETASAGWSHLDLIR